MLSESGEKSVDILVNLLYSKNKNKSITNKEEVTHFTQGEEYLWVAWWPGFYLYLDKIMK